MSEIKKIEVIVRFEDKYYYKRSEAHVSTVSMHIPFLGAYQFDEVLVKSEWWNNGAPGYFRSNNNNQYKTISEDDWLCLVLRSKYVDAF